PLRGSLMGIMGQDALLPGRIGILPHSQEFRHCRQRKTMTTHNHQRPCPTSAVVLGVLLCLAGAALAGPDWPSWRGPSGLGYTDEKDLPLKWDAKSGENILWKTKLHGGAQRDQDFTSPGWSSPIIWKDRVFLTTAIFPAGLSKEERR